MDDRGLERWLARIQERQDAMLETLAVIREKVETTNGHVEDIVAEVGRIPSWETRGERMPITDRLHSVESVVTPVALQAAVHTALNQRRGVAWSRWQVFVTLSGVVVGAIFTVLRFAGLGG